MCNGRRPKTNIDNYQHNIPIQTFQQSLISVMEIQSVEISHKDQEQIFKNEKENRKHEYIGAKTIIVDTIS